LGARSCMGSVHVEVPDTVTSSISGDECGNHSMPETTTIWGMVVYHPFIAIYGHSMFKGLPHYNCTSAPPYEGRSCAKRFKQQALQSLHAEWPWFAVLPTGQLFVVFQNLVDASNPGWCQYFMALRAEPLFLTSHIVCLVSCEYCIHIIWYDIYIYIHIYIYISISLGGWRLPEIDGKSYGTAICCVVSAPVFFCKLSTNKILTLPASRCIFALT
jgi:hypothetical protein